MKLWIKDENKEDQVIDVKFWSFFKCQLLVYIVLSAFIWLIGIFVGLILASSGV